MSSYGSGSDQPFQTAAEWATFGKEHVSHGLGRLRDHVVVKGKGLELETMDGKRLLDFTAGIGVTNLGQYVTLLTTDHHPFRYPISIIPPLCTIC